MAHIVIIGPGVGGIPSAFESRRHLPKQHRVRLIGAWVHLAKIAFEKYFLRKVRTGSLTPIYKTYVLKALGIVSLKGKAP